MLQKAAIANNYRGPFDPAFLALTDEQIAVLAIMEMDQTWAAGIADYHNVSEMIKAHQDNISKTDFYPSNDEEQALFDLFFGWLNSVPGGSGGSSGEGVRRPDGRRVIRIVSDD